MAVPCYPSGLAPGKSPPPLAERLSALEKQENSYPLDGSEAEEEANSWYVRAARWVSELLQRGKIRKLEGEQTQ